MAASKELHILLDLMHSKSGLVVLKLDKHLELVNKYNVPDDVKWAISRMCSSVDLMVCSPQKGNTIYNNSNEDEVDLKDVDFEATLKLNNLPPQ